MSKHLKDAVTVCVMVLSQYYTEALKPTKRLNQDTWKPVQGSNLTPSDYNVKCYRYSVTLRHVWVAS
jgi:hypothetical protein